MSIEHKAWLLDYQAFREELAPILFHALESDEVERLKEFVDQHYASLTDPWTWEQLPENWEEVMRQRGSQLNVLTLGDIALTKYRDVTDNIGLGYGLDALEAYVRSVPALKQKAGALIGGYWFGPRGKRFDPGVMGTGFISLEQAREHLALLTGVALPSIPEPSSAVYHDCYYKPAGTEEVRASLDQLRQIYEMAVDRARGVLFADFNDLPRSSPGW